MSRFDARRRGRGFSLVELLVALVLGLIVVGGLIQVLLANRKSFQIQQSNNYMQQNIRFAADRIGWSLRMADFWGGNRPSIITGTPTVTARGNCNQAWILNVNQATYGYEGGASFPISGCVDNADYVKGSDVLVSRYADPDGMNPAAASTISANASQIYLVSAIGQQAALFRGSEPVPETPPATAVGRYVYPYHVDMYYLRPCSDPSGGTNADHCDAGDDDGSPLPPLMPMSLTSSDTLVTEPLVEGVEQLQFQYGVNGADPSVIRPEQYKNASDMSAQEWARVVTVQVGMVALSNQRDVSIPHLATVSVGNCSYSITATGSTVTGCPDFTVAQSRPWQFNRAAVNQMIQVRNRTRQLVAQ